MDKFLLDEINTFIKVIGFGSVNDFFKNELFVDKDFIFVGLEGVTSFSQLRVDSRKEHAIYEGI
jgi:hypothetical protein